LEPIRKTENVIPGEEGAGNFSVDWDLENEKLDIGARKYSFRLQTANINPLRSIWDDDACFRVCF
jgi:hypothetical protein